MEGGESTHQILMTSKVASVLKRQQGRSTQHANKEHLNTSLNISAGLMQGLMHSPWQHEAIGRGRCNGLHVRPRKQ